MKQNEIVNLKKDRKVYINNLNKNCAVQEDNTKKVHGKLSWPIKIFVLTLALSVISGVFAEMALSTSGLIISMLVIFLLMFVSTIFDALGVAVSACDINLFNDEKIKTLKGAKQAAFLSRHADKVASFCCDIVGDICSILSGSAGAAICIKFVAESGSSLAFFVSILVTSIIASLTVFCKALGKNYAINKSVSILLIGGKMLSCFAIFKRKKIKKNKKISKKKDEKQTDAHNVINLQRKK